MQTLYFFSGFDPEKGFPADIAQSLREHITVRESIVLICTRPDTHEKTDMYANGTVAWFRNIGIEFQAYHVLDDRKTQAECMELTRNASVIYLMGGSPHSQLEFLQKNNIASLLLQFNGVIMGISAGAMTMATNPFYCADKNFGLSHIYKSIGLADISVTPHFSISDKDLLNNEILPFSDIIDIYAMCDDSAIMVCGNKKQYFGDIYFVSKGQVEKCKQADCSK